MTSPIYQHHADLLASGLDLGEPASLETETYDGGLARVFELGRIYFHPRLPSAFEVHGQILERYVQLGEEMSHLGYPTSDESDDPFVLLGRMNTFENGVLRFNPAFGVVEEFNSPDFSPPNRVVVKLVDGFDPQIPAGVEINFASLAQIVGPFPVIVQLSFLLGNSAVRRCLHGVSDQDLANLIARARDETPGYQPPNFNCFVEVDSPTGVDAEHIASLFRQLFGIVEFAYVQPDVEDAAIVGTSNPLFGGQAYLKPAATGVNAKAAWARGADGSGIGFFDIEQGWFLAHEDFRLLIPLLFGGVNRPDSHLHGTAVLGVVLAEDNARGVVGLAPNCDASIVSHRLPRNGRIDTRVGEVIVLTAIAAKRGDVILLEIQNVHRQGGIVRRLPLESLRFEHEVIKMVAATGAVVIEAAGNGGEDLDSIVDVLGLRMLNRTVPSEFRDSGAIFVGGSDSLVPHSRLPRANNGSRIDCFAWAERIATTGDFDNPRRRDGYIDPNRQFSPGVFGFGGTSGASAIIAGVCLLIQHLGSILIHVSGNSRLNCEQMRSLLRNPANGSVSNNPTTDKMGTMPDLAKIIANEFIP